MTTINPNTRRADALRESAKNFEGVYLDDVYSSYSSAKAAAYRYCRNLCDKENGYSFRIISHNFNVFSVAWNTDAGLRIETARNSYFIPYAQ